VVCSEVLGVSSPFYNIFEQITLGDFTPDEADSFLSLPHNGLLLTPLEITFIKTNIKDYRHPLVLQISADSVFHNRKRQDAQDALVRGIHSRVSNYLTHGDVKKGRLMKQRDITNKNTITKPIDIAISILIPVCGLAILMLEYGLLMQWLTNFQAVLLALVTAIIGFGVLVFAGRSIDIISESTFFKLFTSLIRKLPLLSSLAGMLGRHSGEQEP
jgi:hypothetical protein